MMGLIYVTVTQGFLVEASLMTLLESIFPLLLLPLVVVTTHFSSTRKVSVAGITLSVQVLIQSRDMSSRHSIIAMIMQHAQKLWAPSRAHARQAS